MTKSDNFIEPRKDEPLRRMHGPELAALPLMGKRFNGQPKEPPAALFAGRSGRAALTKAIQRRPVSPPVSQTRGNEGPRVNLRLRRGKPMPMHALSAHALSCDFCVAGADQNRLLRHPVPPLWRRLVRERGLGKTYGLGGGNPCQCTP